MKKSSSLFWNPFTRIAGWPAFGIGIVIVAVTVVTGYFSQTLFIGNLQVKLVYGVSFPSLVLVQAASLAISVLVMYLSALILSRNVRFADILGTVTLARWPFLLAAIPGFFTLWRDPEVIRESVFEQTFRIGDIAGLLVAGIIIMIIAVYATVLLYKAYATSSGLKGQKLYISFIIALIISEVAPFILFSQMR